MFEAQSEKPPSSSLLINVKTADAHYAILDLKISATRASYNSSSSIIRLIRPLPQRIPQTFLQLTDRRES
jgi:hypothetical protein